MSVLSLHPREATCCTSSGRGSWAVALGAGAPETAHTVNLEVASERWLRNNRQQHTKFVNIQEKGEGWEKEELKLITWKIKKKF